MDSIRASKICFLVLLLLLMAAFVAIIKPFLVPALVALIIAVICWPVNRLCMRMCRGRRYVAAILATLLVSLCILGPFKRDYYCCGHECCRCGQSRYFPP